MIRIEDSARVKILATGEIGYVLESSVVNCEPIYLVEIAKRNQDGDYEQCNYSQDEIVLD